MNYTQLCEESHAISKEKGWLDVPRSFDGDIALMHEELSEALSDYRSHKGLNESYYELTVVGLDGKKTTAVFSAKEKKEREDSVDLAGNPLVFKPCGIPTELADLVIRIAQYCGSNSIDLAGSIEEFGKHEKWTGEWLSNFETFIRRAHFVLANVSEEGRAHGFTQVVTFVTAFCALNNIDLDSAIKEKAAYNRTRPHRHGGRKI